MSSNEPKNTKELAIDVLKEHSHEIFAFKFFHQTNSIFSDFQLWNRLPGVFVNGKSIRII